MSFILGIEHAFVANESTVFSLDADNYKDNLTNQCFKFKESKNFDEQRKIATHSKFKTNQTIN